MEALHLELLVEEYSAEVALRNLLPKMLPAHVDFDVRSFRGKPDLLKKLPQRLKGYRSWVPDNWRIVVLCDRDNDDCRDLKQTLESHSILSGFDTKSSSTNNHFIVLNRIAIEELEAWFLGDDAAIHQAYPKISVDFATRKVYRTPDEIRGGTWEALQKLLQEKGYYPGGLNKIEAAQKISQWMHPPINRSISFQCFHMGLQALLG